MDGRDRIRPCVALAAAAIVLALVPAAASAQSRYSVSLGAKRASCTNCSYVRRLAVLPGVSATLRTLVRGPALPRGTRLVFRRRVVDPVTGATTTRPRLICPAGARSCYSRRRSDAPAIFEYQATLERGAQVLAVSRIIRVTWTGGATTPAPLPAGTLRFVEMTTEHENGWAVTQLSGRIAYTELHDAAGNHGVYWEFPPTIEAGSTADVSTALSSPLGPPETLTATVTLPAVFGTQWDGKAIGTDGYSATAPLPVSGAFATDQVSTSNAGAPNGSGTIHRYFFTPTRAFARGETQYIAIDVPNGPRVLLKYVAS